MALSVVASAWRSASPLKIWLLFTVAWFATMGWRPLLEPDEGRYAEIPREMQVSGDWVTPRLNDLKYFEKPPLQYWATAVVYTALDVSEGSSRLWSCALAFLCLPTVYYFARKEYESRSAGIAALLALSLNPYFAIIGQLNLLDSGLAFFVSAALLSYLRARRADAQAQRRWMLLAAAALAFGTLSKGLVCLVLVGGTVLLHILVTRDFRSVRQWHLPVTVPLYLAIASPWFVAVSVRNPEFPEFFFLREHFSRYLTDVSDRVQPFWYFLPLLLVAVLPWLRQVCEAFASLRHMKPTDPQAATPWLLVIWCLFTLVFFSLSHSKLATYLLPIMPALAVLLAPHIAAHLDRLRTSAWVCGGLIVFTALSLIVAAARHSAVVPHALIAWALIAATLGICGGMASRRSWLAPALASLLAFQALMMSYTHLAPVRTARPLLAIVRPALGENTQLFSVDQYRQSIPPDLGRTLRLAMYRGELEFGVTQEPERFIPTLAEFETEWNRATDAVAFVDPPQIQNLMTDGVPFRELARDGRTVVISRR